MVVEHIVAGVVDDVVAGLVLVYFGYPVPGRDIVIGVPYYPVKTEEGRDLDAHAAVLHVFKQLFDLCVHSKSISKLKLYVRSPGGGRLLRRRR